MNLSQILPDLYVGSYPESQDDVERLRREVGITAVLNLQCDEDYEYLFCDWPQLEQFYRACGVRVKRVPVDDYDTQSLRRHLPECVRALDELMRAGGKVYVHCTLGMSRSPTVVVTWLFWRKHYALEEALNHVLRCRQCMPDTEAIHLATEDLLGGGD